MQIEQGLPEVLRALDEVADAHRLLRGAASVEWRSGAAERFRAAIEEAEGRVREARAAIERAAQPAAGADADAPPVLAGWS
ncbi:hypothetical protein [Cellulomonas sp. ICMP 17802]|uniref:hypothetical protein n=1 Tax=Cellulomonas sp. ICMP 17802 TaxID=3239199 RepID=UPI00351B270E